MAFRSMMLYALPATIFIAVTSYGLVAGNWNQKLLISIWAVVLITMLCVCREWGTRGVLLTGMVSAAIGAMSSLFIIPNSPDQVARKHVIEALPMAVKLLAGPMIVMTVLGMISMVLAMLVRAAIQQRPRMALWSFVGGTCLTVSIVFVIAFGTARLENTLRQPPPLGVADFQQNEVVPIRIATQGELTSVTEDPYEQLRDITYGPDAANTLDLYLPVGKPGPTPLVVYIHGGGWVANDKDEVNAEGPTPWWKSLARSGKAVAAINYRLAKFGNGAQNNSRSVALFPAQLQDCKAAIRFLRAHAIEYRFDPERVVVVGSSAGGHLAALVGVVNSSKEFDSYGGHQDQSSLVQAAIVLSGVTDLRTFEAQNRFEQATMNIPSWEYSVTTLPDLLGGPVDQKMELAYQASPVSYITPDDPPMLLVHGFRDATVPVHQAENLHCLLREAGVHSELMLIPGAGHVLTMEPEIADRIEKFLAIHLAKRAD